MYKYFEKIAESSAYQPMVCAEGWFDPVTTHEVDTGGKVISVIVDLSDGSNKTNHYCENCYAKLKKEHDEYEMTVQRLPL
mgnify:CR=1 FL=1